MPRKLPVNTRIPIEVQRQLSSLTKWSQEDETRLTALEGSSVGVGASVGASASAAGGGSSSVQDASLTQALTANAAQFVAQPPAHYNSQGQPKQIATDIAGNLYWCYLPNRWARIGSGGYSISF